MSELDDDLGFEPPDDYEPIELVGDVGANRMLRRLRAAEADGARVRELAAEDIAQTTKWRDRRLETISRTIDWARRSLDGWLRATHAAGGPQTVKLPAGTVQLRKSQPRIELTDVQVDETAAAAWLELARSADLTESPVVVKRTLAKAVVAKIVEPGPVTGPADPEGYEPHAAMGPGAEVVEGVTVHVPTRLAFNAKTAVAEEDLDAGIEEATGA
jgi:hypothetical protein